ncbi:allergin-1-like [Thamnophis elegans]|uniref:allergin-1-like n=1 Tax=Thamnophis elegans TaxID=35005 RepID=UPI0013782CAD|nr:allergin-1-like [Thamnophis elegans]
MIERVGFLYLLLTLGVRNTKEYGGDKKGNRTNPESSQNASSCSKDIKIYSPTPEITIGANVTVVCYWETDHCLPINYTLFLNKGRVQGPVLQSTKEQKVLFNTTIHSNSQLGPYKCKAGYMREEAYGPGFNFTLKATKKNLALFIVLPLILLLLLIAAVVTIRLLIFPWCKARKLKSADICTAYNETDYETADYCNLKMKTKTDDRNVNDYEDSTITYAEVICK